MGSERGWLTPLWREPVSDVSRGSRYVDFPSATAPMIAKMRETWQRRIDRAVHLSGEHEVTRSLLRTYGALLGLQRDCYEGLKRSPHRLTGSVDHDLPVLRPCARSMLRGVVTLGSSLLADDARRIIDGGDAALDAVLVAGWREPSGQPFFPKIALQPYAEHLATIKVPPLD